MRLSMKFAPRASRHSSFASSRPPNSSRARRWASSLLNPPCTYFSTCCSRCNRSSSSSSSSTAPRRKSARRRKSRSLTMRASLYCRQHLGHCRRQFSPGVFLHFELPPPASREFVIFRAPVVLRCPPARFDPATALQPVQRGVQRTLLNLQCIARNLLDSLGDGPAMLRFERQRSQDQQVQGALRQVDAFDGHVLPFRFYMGR